ncbi:hypothetical protein N0V93_003170 [Gnomoniopsis smithogilvyi]|uniref:Uncharacterized protein n=1 Tax=Gnomoniopsis smithogilvyi TaxID=1191159 RepID=A0A9W8YY24_9PEZI|nr:hypothetical protein N0V93_003170 [Gnomoniopsis smithogilvyi]
MAIPQETPSSLLFDDSKTFEGPKLRQNNRTMLRRRKPRPSPIIIVPDANISVDTNTHTFNDHNEDSNTNYHNTYDTNEYKHFQQSVSGDDKDHRPSNANLNNYCPRHDADTDETNHSFANDHLWHNRDYGHPNPHGLQNFLSFCYCSVCFRSREHKRKCDADCECNLRRRSGGRGQLVKFG